MNTGNRKPTAVVAPDVNAFTVPVLGEIVAVADGGPVVRVTGASGAIRAQTAVALDASHIGRRVVVLFEGGDAEQPIVVGLLQERVCAAAPSVELLIDDERVTVTARETLVLRCGDARITLTSAGKVLIEGAYISTKSTGVNRITGGSVQIN